MYCAFAMETEELTDSKYLSGERIMVIDPTPELSMW